MAWLLDLIAVAAVVLAVTFLLRPTRGGGCADCGTARAATGAGRPAVAETRVSVDALRVTAGRIGRGRSQ